MDHKKQKTENGSNGAAAEDEGEEEEDAEEEEDIDGEEEEDVDGEGEEDLDEEEGGEGETLIATLSLSTLHKRLTFQLLLYKKHNEVLQLVVHASKTRQTRLLSFHQSMYPSKAIFGPLAKVTCIHTQVSRVQSEISGALKFLIFLAPLKHS